MTLLKRSANTIPAGRPSKKAKVPDEPSSAPPEGQGENWTCRECGNENWPRRSTCNRCKAPGPWTCPGCNNLNFQSRNVCNRKSCSMPRPGFNMMMPGMMMPQAMMGSMMMQAGPNPPGSWICKKCANVNWPLRTSCKKCDISRDEGDPAYLQMCAATGENPAGSWLCSGCQNVNWPKRTSCKKCSLPREQVDAGDPPPTSKPLRARSNVPFPNFAPRPQVNQFQGRNSKSLSAHPTGSWSCSSCENVNWPQRTTCKKCGISKEEGDASWTCESCGNLNWPLRTACNKCKEPKPGP